MKIPKKIYFPFGYTITIKMGKKKDMPDAYGDWDDSTRTIRIRRDLKARRKSYVLVHEMFHALVDFQHWAAMNQKL